MECPGCWGDVSKKGLTGEGSQQWHVECLHRRHSIDETVASQPAYSSFFGDTNTSVHCLTLWHTLLYPPPPHQPWTLSLVPFPHQHFILWPTVFSLSFFNTHIWSLFFSAWGISLFLSQPEISFQLEDSFEILHLLWVWRDLKLRVAYNIHAYYKRSLGHNSVNQMLVFRNSIMTR